MIMNYNKRYDVRYTTRQESMYDIT